MIKYKNVGKILDQKYFFLLVKVIEIPRKILMQKENMLRYDFFRYFHCEFHIYIFF